LQGPPQVGLSLGHSHFSFVHWPTTAWEGWVAQCLPSHRLRTFCRAGYGTHMWFLALLSAVAFVVAAGLSTRTALRLGTICWGLPLATGALSCVHLALSDSGSSTAGVAIPFAILGALPGTLFGVGIGKWVRDRSEHDRV
jgi:hypothetical protein